MKTPKYELIQSDIPGLFRVKALRDFGNVKVGDIGGYVKGERNLSHQGNCWIYDDAKVFENAEVFGDAKVSERAKVSGDAIVYGHAEVYGDAQVFGDARLFGLGEVFGNTIVWGDRKII